MAAETDKRPWKEKVRDLQQQYYEVFADRDWDCYKATELEFLLRNVGHAIFGPPDELPDNEKNGNTGYCAKKLEAIRKVCDVIKEHCQYPSEKKEQDVWMSVIFVCLNQDGACVPVPVFRIPHHVRERCTVQRRRVSFSLWRRRPHGRVFKSKLWVRSCLVRLAKTGTRFTAGKVESSMQFVDSNCRVYKDWSDFLDNNQLPKCEYCYPVRGVYDGDSSDQVLVEFGKTPASKVKNQICSMLDTASTAVMVGGIAVTAAACFVTVAAPVAAATVVGSVTTGIYGIGRSTAALVDRQKHKQSIGIKDAEARGHWFSVVGSSLSMASTRAIQTVTKMAQSGEVLSKSGCLIVNALNFGSLAVNGLGVVNHLFVLKEKRKHGELTSLDIFQFASSVLFFTMSAVSAKTADRMIRETQNTTITNFEDSLRSKRHQRMFRKVAKATRGEDGNSLQGNAKVIRGIMHITDKDDFFAGLVRVQKQLSKSGAEVTFTDSGHVMINGNLELHPMKFWEFEREQRALILDATKNLNKGVWSQEQFNKEMESLCQGRNLTLETQRPATCSSIRQVVAGDKQKEYLLQLTNSQLDMLSIKLCRFLVEHRHKIIRIALNLAEMMGYNKTAEFVRVVAFVANYVEQVVGEVEAKYQQDVAAAQAALGDWFNREKFDEDYKIQGNREQHFITVVLSNYNTYEALRQLKQLFSREAEPRPEPPQTAALTESVRQFGKKDQRHIVSIVVDLADMLNYHNSLLVEAVANFVVRFVKELVDKMEDAYQVDLQKAQASAGASFNHAEFDERYNIEGARRDHFMGNVLNNYRDIDQLKQLRGEFLAEQERSRAGPSHSEHVVEFESRGEVSDSEVYSVASEVTGLPLSQGNSSLVRDGNLCFLTITDRQFEPVTVMVRRTSTNAINALLLV